MMFTFTKRGRGSQFCFCAALVVAWPDLRVGAPAVVAILELRDREIAFTPPKFESILDFCNKFRAEC
jgi:hypothetical protein